MRAFKNDIISRLENAILPLGGLKQLSTDNNIDFKPIENAFPNKCFPVGCMHDFLSQSVEHSSATQGFVSGLLSKFMHLGGVCIWISASRTVFSAALNFGIEPHQIIFIDLKKEKDVLYAMEEALHCDKLVSVVGEVSDISFKQSRRFQLAVEQSRVTGFILRNQQRALNTIACVSRWKVTSLPSQLEKGMPGVGFPQGNVELLKVRNGYCLPGN